MGVNNLGFFFVMDIAPVTDKSLALSTSGRDISLATRGFAKVNSVQNECFFVFVRRIISLYVHVQTVLLGRYTVQNYCPLFQLWTKSRQTEKEEDDDDDTTADVQSHPTPNCAPVILRFRL